jgi:hypothetical protein
MLDRIALCNESLRGLEQQKVTIKVSTRCKWCNAALGTEKEVRESHNAMIPLWHRPSNESEQTRETQITESDAETMAKRVCCEIAFVIKRFAEMLN